MIIVDTEKGSETASKGLGKSWSQSRCAAEWEDSWGQGLPGEGGESPWGPSGAGLSRQSPSYTSARNRTARGIGASLGMVMGWGWARTWACRWGLTSGFSEGNERQTWLQKNSAWGWEPHLRQPHGKGAKLWLGCFLALPLQQNHSLGRSVLRTSPDKDSLNSY